MAETKTSKTPGTRKPSGTTTRSRGAKPVAGKAAARASAKPKNKPVAKRAAPSKKARLATELVVEVKALRTALDEMVEQFRIKLGGQIAQIEAVLEGRAVAGARPATPDAKTAAAMLKQVRALKIKPKKGRTKDLARLSDLIEDLADMLPPQP